MISSGYSEEQISYDCKSASVTPLVDRYKDWRYLMNMTCYQVEWSLSKPNGD